jgi:light-regulated signal transduction histidine kinase (bacteriophytochrome)
MSSQAARGLTEPASDTDARIEALKQELAAALDRASLLQAKLKAAQEEFQQFALRASHDFQESLRAVNTFSQLLAELRGEDFSDRERQYVGYMLSGTDRMRDLLDYILIYSQAASDNPATYSMVDMKGVAHGAVKSLHGPISESGANVTVSPALPMIWGNFLRLQQVLRSLISNAIKYRNPDVPVEIRIDAARDVAGEWKISVRDNGIGIPKQYHESVFAPFKRLHGKNIPGCGMGLTVCRRIVEAHGGRMRVESSSDGGCDFHFTLREEPLSAS